MKAIKTNKNAILSWAKEIEEPALKQLINAAEHPCINMPIAVCPDVHAGFGVTIGCVLPVTDALIPNAVGVDIGCSMSAAKTNIRVEDVSTELLKKIVGGAKGYPGGIRANIPVGQSHHKVKQDHCIFANRDMWNDTLICAQELESAQYQLGTMGGGNHFIELQAGDDGFLYYMIHSGSRNLGYKVGQYYDKLAKDLCSKYKQDRVVQDDLAFLPRGTKEFDMYFKEMNLCLYFAKANHERMQEILEGILKHNIPEIEFTKRWYTRHNYAAIENHKGVNYFIHRKGAIKARVGDEQIIPGSQGTASYIVEGLGNVDSYCSASHGSGRVMSRRQATASLNLAEEQKKMEGIVHNMTTNKQLDEAPSAYKDIEDVLKQEADLVKKIVKLKPIAVVKE